MDSGHAGDDGYAGEKHETALKTAVMGAEAKAAGPKPASEKKSEPSGEERSVLRRADRLLKQLERELKR